MTILYLSLIFEKILLGTISVALLIGTLGVFVFSQNKAGGKNRLPRVGAIRNDEKVSDGKPGCGNHLLYRKEYADKAIFLSDDDGFNAWMNLNGHNAELKLVKTTLYHRDQFSSFAVYQYRFRNTWITVSLDRLTDYLVWIPAKIVIRNGNAARTIKAFITPQCD